MRRMLSFSRGTKKPSADTDNPFATAVGVSEGSEADPGESVSRESRADSTEDAASDWSRTTTPRPEIAPVANARKSAASGFSLFHSDPDKVHDKKLAGLALDPSVTAAKQSLRRLRTAAEAAAKFYDKYDAGVPLTARSPSDPVGPSVQVRGRQARCESAGSARDCRVVAPRGLLRCRGEQLLALP